MTAKNPAKISVHTVRPLRRRTRKKTILSLYSILARFLAIASSTALSSLKSSSLLDVVLLVLVLETFDFDGSGGAGRLAAPFNWLTAAEEAGATADEDTAGVAMGRVAVDEITAREFTDEVTGSRRGCALRLEVGCLLDSGGGACVEN